MIVPDVPVSEPLTLCWLRRDLRLQDNAALFHSLKSGLPVLPVFIFDSTILGQLEAKTDARVSFIHQTILELKIELEKLGSSLLICYGNPLEVWREIESKYSIKAVYANHDYEPQAIKRDKAVGELLQSSGIAFYTYKDQVIFEQDEVTKEDGKPYTVYTPYSNKWKQKLNDFYLKSYPCETLFSKLLKIKSFPNISLQQIGFTKSSIEIPLNTVQKDILSHYHETRDIPGIAGTSRLGLHLRFGTISIRQLSAQALTLNPTYLNELIWREFFMQILWHFPQVATQSFKPKYDNIQWLNTVEHFERWCKGQTGFPIVDAGMQELAATGFMHNRVRMITASFLVKNLLIDWRWGEAWFAQKLLDFDLAANNGNWQWAAGCGTDAAPYFRVFNPNTQAERFDPQTLYIKKWVPEFGSFDYPQPMVDLKVSRERCLKVYKAAVG